MKIYKDDVIEALEEETDLGFGNFFKPTEIDYDGFRSYWQEIASCEVCAVGSVLRHGFISRNTPANQGSTIAEVATGGIFTTGCGRPANYLSALSMFWESLGENDVPVEEARRITIDWVEETFPDDEVLGEV